jgi:hypothetical protein
VGRIFFQADNYQSPDLHRTRGSCDPNCCVAVAFVLMVSTAEARRVAPVVGQNAYVGLASLDNPAHDARSVAELLAKHGFELIGCDGKVPAVSISTESGFLAR